MNTLKSLLKGIRNHTLKVLYSKRVVKYTSRYGKMVVSFPLTVYLMRAFYDPDVSEHTYNKISKHDTAKIEAFYTYKADLDDRTYGIILNDEHHRRNIA